MQLRMFCVYDSKVEAYLPPWYQQTTAAGIRAFSDTVMDETTMLSKHPADYTLFEIGTFDQDTGRCEMYEANRNLGCAVEFKEFGKPSIMEVED